MSRELDVKPVVEKKRSPVTGVDAVRLHDRLWNNFLPRHVSPSTFAPFRAARRRPFRRWTVQRRRVDPSLRAAGAIDDATMPQLPVEAAMTTDTSKRQRSWPPRRPGA